MTPMSRNAKEEEPMGAPTQSRPDALVFDFDGVIADTEPLYWRAWCELLKPYAIAFAWDEYCRIGRGIRDENMLASLAEKVGDAEVMEQIKGKLSERNEMVRAWKRTEPPIAPATVELLRSLRGWKRGLVTSSDRAHIEFLLHNAGIADLFDAYVFGDEVARHKPDPAPYLLIRHKLGVVGGVVFEDSEPGILSARAAEFVAVRVPRPEDLPRLVREVLDCAGART